MEYGSAYLRASGTIEEDTISMLSAPELTSQYHVYHPDHSRNSSNSSEDSTANRASWSLSPTHLQQSLPPLPPASGPSPSPHMRPSIFGNRAALESPYQEPVAWANSTHFRSTSAEEPKPEARAAVFVVSENVLPPPKETRQYFRHPRHIPEPWKAGFWLRFPRLGFGALFLVVVLTGVSAGVLLASNGTSMHDWKVGSDNAQPAVYISAIGMFIDLLLLFALAEGVVIRFWRQLLHGTTLSSMHDVYDSACLCSAMKRLTHLRFNTVAVATTLTALSLARGPLFQRSLTLSPTTSLYTVHYIPLIFGILLSLAPVAAILPLYNGFWELGRRVSLNPLEIARAFGAPLLEGLDGNADPDVVTIERGGMAVRYGVVERFGVEKQLRVEERSKATVRVPWEGEVFG